MVEMKYVLTVFYNLVKDGEVIDEQMEQAYDDTYNEAQEAAEEQYPVGTVNGGYGDGTQCIVSEIMISDDPEPIDFV